MALLLRFFPKKTLGNSTSNTCRMFSTVNRKRRINLTTLEEKEIMDQNWELRCQLATAYRAFERYVCTFKKY